MSELNAPRVSLNRYAKLGMAAPPTTALQARRMVSGNFEGRPEDYKVGALEEGRVRRRIEDIEQARALGISLEEYLAAVS